MKTRNLLIGLALLAMQSAVIAQSGSFPCDKGTSTNPDNPVNTDAALTPSQQQQFTNSFFDWRDDLWKIIQNGYYAIHDFDGDGVVQLQSPFTPAVGPLYLASNNSALRDYHPEDGWELISVNLGYYPNGDITPDITLDDVPYVILYNKYRNILRVFGIWANRLENFKSVEVKLMFPINPDNVAGTLMHGKELAQPLDQKTDVKELVSLVGEYANSELRFFHADFPVAYDPCVCHYQSDLQVKFLFLKPTSHVKLNGRFLGLNVPITDASSGDLEVLNQDFLNSIFKEGKDAKAGATIYKDIQKMSDKYKALSQSKPTDKTLENVANGLGLLKDILTNVVPVAGTINQLTGGLKKLSKNKALDSSLTAVAKGIPFFSDLLKRFAGGGGSSGKPTSMPSLIEAEMTFSGEIFEDPVTPGSTTFSNPGSFFTGGSNIAAQNYPVYNEAMGLFALLEMPKVKRYKQSPAYSFSKTSSFTLGNPNPCFSNNPTFTKTVNVIQDASMDLQYQLAEPLQYVFNPSVKVNLANTTIKAAWVINGVAVPIKSAPAFLNHTIITTNTLEEDNLLYRTL